jgi:hypothetical protein
MSKRVAYLATVVSLFATSTDTFADATWWRSGIPVARFTAPSFWGDNLA